MIVSWAAGSFAMLACCAALNLLPSSTGANTDWLLENDSVLAVLNTYAPGDRSGQHEHVHPRFVYTLAGGLLESVEESGSSTRTFNRQSCFYAAPVAHSVTNVGQSTVRLLEVEIKGSAGPVEKLVPCPPPPREPAARGKKRGLRGTRRTILFEDSDLIASRIELSAGAKERHSPARGPRFVYVVSGGPLESEQRNGKRAIATEAAALWIGQSAPLVNRGESRDLVLIEIEPKAGRAEE